MLHIAIVEDEELYRGQLKTLLKQYQEERGTGLKITEFADGEDILEDYEGGYDIIFLDIQMRFMDGMTTAKKIRELDSSVILMFITNMTQYAIQGYQVNAMDYIVKPVEYFALKKKLDKAMEKLEDKKKYYIRIPIAEGIMRMDISSIYWIESQGHQLIYQTKTGQYVSRGIMKDMEAMMELHGFFCCSKGILVNMEHVEGVKENICMINSRQIPISRRKKKLFMEKLLEFVDEEV